MIDQAIARKAAKWWADHLRTPAMMDNGDRSEAGFMASVMATMLQESKMSAISEEDILRFEDSLTNIIIIEAADRNLFALRVDYHPDRTLSKAADAAGIDIDTVLPWKTTMWIEGDTVQVSHGYGASVETLE